MQGCIVKCKRCGREFMGPNLDAATFLYDTHTCEGHRSLDDMPLDLLKHMAKDLITEDEAWEIAEERGM